MIDFKLMFSHKLVADERNRFFEVERLFVFADYDRLRVGCEGS